MRIRFPVAKSFWRLLKPRRTVGFGSIAEQLGLSEERDLDALGKRLRAMQREGQIISGRRGAYGVPKRMDLLRCRMMGHRDGYGFARPLEGGDDLYFVGPRDVSGF